MDIVDDDEDDNEEEIHDLCIRCSNPEHINDICAKFPIKTKGGKKEAFAMIDDLKAYIKSGMTHSEFAKKYLDKNNSCKFKIKFVSTTLKKPKTGPLTILKPSNQKTTFQYTKTFRDIIGLDNAKEKLKDEIYNRTIYRTELKECGKDLGEGVIIAGIPGIGKTMLARAIVNEPEFNNLEFYGELSISDFTAESQTSTDIKIRTLFADIDEKSENNEKTEIVLIHEIDSILHKRGSRNSTINDARISTILSLTGGGNDREFNKIFIGTTNMPHVIDPAAIRNGRYPLIFAEAPNETDRKILAMKYIPISTIPMNMCDEDWNKIAKDTLGYVGADFSRIGLDYFNWYKRKIRKQEIDNSYVIKYLDFEQFMKINTNERIYQQNKIKEYIDIWESNDGYKKSKSRRHDSIEFSDYPSEAEMLSDCLENEKLIPTKFLDNLHNIKNGKNWEFHSSTIKEIWKTYIKSRQQE